ncbi:unnamed protein product [Ixodes pacificus]
MLTTCGRDHVKLIWGHLTDWSHFRASRPTRLQLTMNHRTTMTWYKQGTEPRHHGRLTQNPASIVLRLLVPVPHHRTTGSPDQRLHRLLHSCLGAPHDQADLRSATSRRHHELCREEGLLCHCVRVECRVSVNLIVTLSYL